jgi:hypothetical protein
LDACRAKEVKSHAHAETQRKFAAVVAALTGHCGVTAGAGNKGFGGSALRVESRIFAMISSRGEFVVKLPRKRVEALVAAGGGQRFDPGHGRLMKEWLATDAGSVENWLGLASEALKFVRSTA